MIEPLKINWLKQSQGWTVLKKGTICKYESGEGELTKSHITEIFGQIFEIFESMEVSVKAGSDGDIDHDDSAVNDWKGRMALSQKDNRSIICSLLLFYCIV